MFRYLSANVIRDPFLESPEKLFLVCPVYIQDRDINCFEIQTINMSGNKTEWSQNPHYYF